MTDSYKCQGCGHDPHDPRVCPERPKFSADPRCLCDYTRTQTYPVQHNARGRQIEDYAMDSRD